MNNPPFQPPVFTNLIPKGGWSLWSGPWEDGASVFANSGPIKYNGQDQTAHINSAYLPPPPSPAKCTMPHAAVGMSQIFSQP